MKLNTNKITKEDKKRNCNMRKLRPKMEKKIAIWENCVRKSNQRSYKEIIEWKKKLRELGPKIRMEGGGWIVTYIPY